MMKRDSFYCLNGQWEFGISAHGPKYARSILVPYPPESALSGLELRHVKGELLYYRRKFCLPDGFLKDRLLLHFGSVARIASAPREDLAALVGQSLAARIQAALSPTLFDRTE